MKLTRRVIGATVAASLYFAGTGPCQVSGPYLDQEPPGMRPQPFAPGIVSLPDRCEVGGFFSPDMSEFYFTETDGRWTWTRVLVTTRHNGVWTTPVYDPLFSLNDSLCKFLLDDSDRMYFYRPSPSTQNDVWTAERIGSGWGNFERLPEPINSNAAEWGFTRALDGTVYISSTRSGNADIYRIRQVDGQYGPAEPLAICNTSSGENGPYVAPDHSYLMFHSQRPNGYGKGDLYVSFRSRDDTWSAPMNLGPRVNTAIEQWDPKISPDGKYLFYIHRTGWTSDSDKSDIYWVDARAVLPDPNGPIRNLTTGQRFGSVQCAIQYAHSGDTIVIGPGVYAESIDLTGKDLVLQSVDPNDPFYIGGTIIQGWADSPVVILDGNSETCEIAGLTLRAGAIGIQGTTTRAVIRHCRTLDNVTHGLELFERSSPMLSHCLITANGGTGITMWPATGRGNRPCTPRVENCVIVQNGQADLVGGEPDLIDSITTATRSEIRDTVPKRLMNARHGELATVSRPGRRFERRRSGRTRD